MSYRISVWLLLILVSTNAGHVMLDTTGTYGYMDVEPNIGDTSGIEDARSDVSNADVGSGSVTESFVAVASSITQVINGLLDTIFLWRPVLKSLGVPSEIVDYGTATYSFIIAVDLLKLWRSG